MRKILTFLLFAPAAFAQNQYTLLNTIPVPGDGGWDYLTADAGASRLYVSHGTQVEVIDTKTNAVIGTIPNTKGVHGIAITGGRAYVTNGATNDVAVIDAGGMKEASRIKTGEKPDAIIYDEGSQRLVINNGKSGDSTIVDPATGVVTGTIKLGGAPEFAAGDGHGKVFVNLEDKNETLQIDPVALKVDARWPLKPCDEPSAMAIDNATHRVFVGCGNKMAMVLDSATGKIVGHMPIGDHVDAAAFDPDTKLVFFSNADGTLNIFHEDGKGQLTAFQTLKTEPGAKTMALDPATHRIYVSTAQRQARVVKPGTFHVLVYGN